MKKAYFFYEGCKDILDKGKIFFNLNPKFSEAKDIYLYKDSPFEENAELQFSPHLNLFFVKDLNTKLAEGFIDATSRKRFYIPNSFIWSDSHRVFFTPEEAKTLKNKEQINKMSVIIFNNARYNILEKPFIKLKSLYPENFEGRDVVVYKNMYPPVDIGGDLIFIIIDSWHQLGVSQKLISLEKDLHEAKENGRRVPTIFVWVRDLENIWELNKNRRKIIIHNRTEKVLPNEAIHLFRAKYPEYFIPKQLNQQTSSIIVNNISSLSITKADINLVVFDGSKDNCLKQLEVLVNAEPSPKGKTVLCYDVSQPSQEIFDFRQQRKHKIICVYFDTTSKVDYVTILEKEFPKLFEDSYVLSKRHVPVNLEEGDIFFLITDDKKQSSIFTRLQKDLQNINPEKRDKCFVFDTKTGQVQKASEAARRRIVIFDRSSEGIKFPIKVIEQSMPSFFTGCTDIKILKNAPLYTKNVDVAVLIVDDNSSPAISIFKRMVQESDNEIDLWILKPECPEKDEALRFCYENDFDPDATELKLLKAFWAYGAIRKGLMHDLFTSDLITVKEPFEINGKTLVIGYDVINLAFAQTIKLSSDHEGTVTIKIVFHSHEVFLRGKDDLNDEKDFSTTKVYEALKLIMLGRWHEANSVFMGSST